MVACAALTEEGEILTNSLSLTANKIAKTQTRISSPFSAKILPRSQTIGQHLYHLLICSAGKQSGNTCIGYLFIYLLVCRRMDITCVGESTSLE